jgi:porin
MLPFEIGYEPGGGAGQLPGHYKVGFYYDTSKRSDYYYDVNGNPLVRTGLPARQDSGQVGVWVEADQMFMRHGPGPTQGLVGFAGYAHTDGNVGNYQDEAFIGVDDHGFFPTRPADGFGAMVTYGQQSSALAKTEELEIALGQQLEYGVAKHEIVLEAEYTAHVYNGIDIGPDIQYIIRPGGSSKYSNAFIVGLQANISF